QVQREEVSDISSVSSPQTGRRKLNVREKSRQMVKYVHEQRAARTLSIVCGIIHLILDEGCSNHYAMVA
ncbi:hypothetical protein ANCDUO_15211, partial [Ancylostoma duodenale]